MGETENDRESRRRTRGQSEQKHKFSQPLLPPVGMAGQSPPERVEARADPEDDLQHVGVRREVVVLAELVHVRDPERPLAQDEGGVDLGHGQGYNDLAANPLLPSALTA